MSKLKLHRLLDERWDDVLERAARAVAAAVDAPCAYVSVLDERLQHFAAHVGLPPELEVSRAVAREVGFCRTVVDGHRAVAIPDTVESPQLRPELIDAFQFRAWVGVPVVVQGVVVGTLSALDHRPRIFGDDDVARVKDLVAPVEARLAARAALRHADAGAVEVADAGLRPYLRLLQALQVGALTPEAMARALRVLPAVPAAAR